MTAATDGLRVRARCAHPRASGRENRAAAERLAEQERVPGETAGGLGRLPLQGGPRTTS
jgi:hypothetical protein